MTQWLQRPSSTTLSRTIVADLAITLSEWVEDDSLKTDFRQLEELYSATQYPQLYPELSKVNVKQFSEELLNRVQKILQHWLTS